MLTETKFHIPHGTLESVVDKLESDLLIWSEGSGSDGNRTYRWHAGFNVSGRFTVWVRAEAKGQRVLFNNQYYTAQDFTAALEDWLDKNEEKVTECFYVCEVTKHTTWWLYS